MGRFERARKQIFLVVLGVFLAGATTVQAGLSEEAGETTIGQNPSVVVEELRVGLGGSLRGDLIAAMRVEIAEAVAAARQSAPVERETELAGQFSGEETLVLGQY